MNPFAMSEKTYEFVKKLVRVILPAFSAMYFALANIWGLPAAEQVVGTMAVITTFLGVSLNISTSNYEGDGTVLTHTDDDTGKITYTFDVNMPVDDIPNKKQLVLKVAS